MFNRNNRNKKGYSLVEAAVVLVLLGILTAMVAPRFFSMYEDSDAATIRAILADVDMSVNQALSRGISITDIRNPGGRLPDVVALSAESFTEGVTMGTTATNGEIAVAVATHGPTRNATIMIQTTGVVEITGISGFTIYNLVGGDLNRI